MLAPLKKGGIVFANSKHVTAENIETKWHPKTLRTIAEKEARLFVIDAQRISQEVGLNKRINTIM